ncbi:MAG: hypothetical protein PHN75_04310, partial [Syntrophales bacterium]|nr:hypothetical protein [Syntrophales bacterium]
RSTRNIFIRTAGIKLSSPCNGGVEKPILEGGCFSAALRSSIRDDLQAARIEATQAYFSYVEETSDEANAESARIQDRMEEIKL